MEVNMRKLVLAGLTVVAAASAATSAEAAQGCGPGFHRGIYGRCYPNVGPYAYSPGGIAIETFYPGRGYWYGGRFWGHRYGWRGGWRYR